MVSVYILIDPLTEEIRYVGWTSKSLPARLKRHLHQIDSKGYGKSHRASWLKSLKGKGLTPRITLVQIVPDGSWVAAERYWISFFKSQGCPLTNGTEGGEGTPGHFVSNELRQQIG